MRRVWWALVIGVAGALWSVPAEAVPPFGAVERLKATNRCARCDLSGANLSEANLRGADLTGADLDNAKLQSIQLEGATYEPATAPSKGHLSGLKGLATVRFAPGQQGALVLLRAALTEVGLRELEREATFAIESVKTRHLLNGGREKPHERGLAERLLDYPGSMPEGAFRLVAFEGTTCWGLCYGRPLWIMIAGIGVMGIVYLVPLAGLPRSGAIYRVWPRGRITDDPWGVATADEEVAERLRPHGLGVLGYAFYFSALSGFHIGWRELNVGSWLTRMQTREYALRARGWVRVVSGAQSLVSVYLIAMWALTYFGRPFQ